MNEDESTQALSDKVVDRACVLRFWRPKNTNPATGQAPCKPTENALTYTNWKKWLAKQNNLETVSGDIDGWIIRLNEALTELGRPFAFRVDKAIRTYVAHYPSWVPGWHRKAMADQIEQRILPKLRGVETELAQEPLQRIGAVVRELEDVPLEKAYSESWQNQPTFLFRGVSRDETE
jgi:hypothetical protein